MIDVAEFGLRPGDLVLLDSSPLIYLSDPSAAAARGADRADAVRAFLDAARSGGVRLAASTLAWTECLAGPHKAGDAARADGIRAALTADSRVVFEPVDIAVAEEAARLGALAPALGLADAVHLATAAVIGAAAVLTNDEAWRRVAAAAGREPGTGPARAYRSLRVLLVDELEF